MTTRVFVLSACIGALLYFCVASTCGEILFLNVRSSVLPGGDTILLSWNAVSRIDGYYVYLDGARYPVSETSYKVSTPTKMIDVSAHAGAGETDKWTLNTGVVKTTNLTVNDPRGSGPNCAFYFNASGEPVAIPRTQISDMDFVMDTSGTDIVMRSPDSSAPVYNHKHNSSALAATTDFDSCEVAEAPGAHGSTRILSRGSVYSLWIDTTSGGWSADDHFAKMKVEYIGGNTLVLTFGYQLIGGLRWLVSK